MAFQLNSKLEYTPFDLTSLLWESVFRDPNAHLQMNFEHAIACK